MTPTPSSGDIWEWTRHELDDGPGVYVLFNYVLEGYISYWRALNLLSGDLEDISINEHNLPHWRKLA